MDNNQALHEAIAKKDMDMFLNLLHQPDIDLNCKNKGGKTLLIASIEGSNCIMAKHLIEAGCDVNLTEDGWKNSPLCAAVSARQGRTQWFQKFTNMFLWPFTPISMEEWEFPSNDPSVDLELVSMLLYFGADVNLANNRNETPIMQTFNYGIDEDMAMGKLLLNCYDDFSCRTTVEGRTALHMAAQVESPLVIDLVERGADVNTIDKYGECLLYHTIRNTDAKLFKFIWSRTDPKLILRMEDSVTTFLLYYIKECHLDDSDFLECLYLILESPIADLLIEECAKSQYIDDNYSLVYYLLKMFIERNILPTDRISLIYIWLRFGGEIKIGDLQYAYKLYGFNEEFKILLYAGNLSCYDYAEEIRHCIKEDYYLKGFCSLYLENKDTLITQLQTFAPKLKNLLEALKEVPEFPSLLELSRNKAQQFIQKNCNVTKFYEFYDAVNWFKLPQVLKDVILFKTPIYTTFVVLEFEDEDENDF